MLSATIHLSLPGSLPLGTSTGGGGGGGGGGTNPPPGTLSYTGDYGKPGIDAGFTNADGALISTPLIPYDPSFYYVEAGIDASAYAPTPTAQTTYPNHVSPTQRISRVAATTTNGVIFAMLTTKYEASTSRVLGKMLHIAQVDKTTNSVATGDVSLRDLFPQGVDVMKVTFEIDGYYDGKLFITGMDAAGNSMTVEVQVVGAPGSKQYQRNGPQSPYAYIALANGNNNLQTTNTASGHRARSHVMGGGKYSFSNTRYVTGQMNKDNNGYYTYLSSADMVASTTSSFADTSGNPIYGATGAKITDHAQAARGSSNTDVWTSLLSDYTFNGQAYTMRETIPPKFGGYLNYEPSNPSWAPRVWLQAQPSNFSLPALGSGCKLQLGSTYNGAKSLFATNLELATPDTTDPVNKSGTALFARKRYYLSGTPWEDFELGTDFGYAEVPWTTSVADKYGFPWLFVGNTNTEIFSVNGTIARGYTAPRVLGWAAGTETYTAYSQNKLKNAMAAVKASDFSVALGKGWPLTHMVQLFSNDYSAVIGESNQLLFINTATKRTTILRAGERVRAGEPLWMNDATGTANQALDKIISYKQTTARNEIMAYRQFSNKVAVMHGTPCYYATDDMREFLTSVHIGVYNKPTV